MSEATLTVDTKPEISGVTELVSSDTGRLRRIASGFTKLPWLIEEDKFDSLVEIINHENSVKGSTAIDTKQSDKYAAVGELVEVAGGAWYRRSNSLAIIPIQGTIFPKGNFFSSFSGSLSAQGIISSVMACSDDPKVNTILFDVDSPGGYVAGVPECADVIYNARKDVKIVSHVSEAYSAAYYLASQSNEIVVTKSGGVGSIGVLTIHKSIARLNEDNGIDVTIIRIPEWKAEANPYEKLTESAKKNILEEIGGVYDDFVSAVARGRKVEASDVKKNYGKGRTLNAEDGLKTGMVDRIEAWHETLARVQEESDKRRSGTTKRSFTMAEPTDTVVAETVEPVVATAVEDKNAELQAQIDELKKQAEDNKAALVQAVEKGAKTEEKLQKSEEARLAKEATEFVDSLDALTLNAEDHGPLIARMRENMTTEDATAIESVLVAANTAAKQSGIFDAQTDKDKTKVDVSGDSNSKLWQQANTAVEKGEFKNQAEALASITAGRSAQVVKASLNEHVDNMKRVA